MLKTFKFTAPALLLAIVASGQTSHRAITLADPIKKEVVEAYRRGNEASLRGDWDVLDRLLADNFVSFGPLGESIGDKASVLSLMRSGRYKITYHKDITLAVSVRGEKALATGEAITKGERDGQDFIMRYRFSDTFVYRQGGWQIALSRITKILR